MLYSKLSAFQKKLKVYQGAVQFEYNLMVNITEMLTWAKDSTMFPDFFGSLTNTREQGKGGKYKKKKKNELGSSRLQ